MFIPSYIALYNSGELEQRANALKKRLTFCDICPRECGIDRLNGQRGYCRSGHEVEISSYCDHHGEEPALSEVNGSGTIFFSHCNLKCMYCQNYQISQATDLTPITMDTQELAAVMLHLQNDLGCHNINLVSPSHYVPQIVEAVYRAIPMGLSIPLVYNTNAYDALSTLHLLDRIIDLYLPDIKYSSNELALKYSDAKNYVTYSRTAIKEMYRQVGNLVTNAQGVALRGLIIRHLILPNAISGSEDSLKWIASELSSDVTVSIMAQYYPCYKAYSEPLLSRKISFDEYTKVLNLIDKLRMANGWLQKMDSPEHYIPDFKQQEHPFEKPQQ